MKTYGLYLESGPKRRKTMVHVPELLGCVQTGATTDEAVDSTPEAIRAFLALLTRAGERVDPDAAFETRIAEHVTEGPWLGNGDPYVLFSTDLNDPAPKDVRRAAVRFARIRDEIVEMVSGLGARALAAKPRPHGRPIGAIVNHVLAAAPGYVSYVMGSQRELNAVAREAERGSLGPVEALERARDLTLAQLRAMKPEHRTVRRTSGKAEWTATKMLRRLLEHEWEHHQELTRRLS